LRVKIRFSALLSLARTAWEERAATAAEFMTIRLISSTRSIVKNQKVRKSNVNQFRETFCDVARRTLKGDRFRPIRDESKQSLRIQPMSSDCDFGTGGKREWEFGMKNAQI
jgi:hypothetical protein